MRYPSPFSSANWKRKQLQNNQKSFRIHQFIRTTMSLCHHNISNNSSHDLDSTANHCQDFTNNNHCVDQSMTIRVRLSQQYNKAWKYKQSVKRSCWEDQFIDEFTQSSNLIFFTACDMMWSQISGNSQAVHVFRNIWCTAEVPCYWDLEICDVIKSFSSLKDHLIFIWLMRYSHERIQHKFLFSNNISHIFLQNINWKLSFGCFE